MRTDRTKLVLAGLVLSLVISETSLAEEINVSLGGLFGGGNCDISKCHQEWEGRGGYNGVQSLSRAKEITSNEQYVEAKAFATFRERCSCYLRSNQQIDSYLRQSESDLEKKAKAYEPTYKDFMAKKSACTQYDACVTEFKKHPKTWFNQYRAPTPEEFAARIDRDLANQPVNMESSDESFLEESEHDFNKNRDDALSQYKNLSGLQTKCACLFDVTGRAKPFFKVLDDKIQSFEAKQKELAEKQKKANERNKVAAKKAAEKQKQAEALQSKIQAERDAKDSTPACRTARAKKNYCERMKVVRTLELQIEHEKEVGRQSGYVDAARLNGNTSAKITLEQLSEKDRATYKEVSGKSISRSDCPIEDQPPFGVKLGPSIAAEVTQSCGS